MRLRRQLAMWLAPDLARVHWHCCEALDALEREPLDMDDVRDAHTHTQAALEQLRGGPRPLPLPPQQP